jgi:hypothetical protein
LRLWFVRLFPDGNGLQLLCALEKKKYRVSGCGSVGFFLMGTACTGISSGTLPILSL